MKETDMVQRFLAIASLAILAFLTATGTSHAQSSRQGTYIYQDSPRGYSAPPSAGAYYPSANVENSRAYYPGSADADKVLLNVTVPADAKITFQGAKTTQTGGQRRFMSPSIAAGYRYSYTVQATWMENGQEVSQSRSIAVQPGDVVQVTFTRNGVQVRSEN
jgi:uncharacterized protein (TIGR03000 family)